LAIVSIVPLTADEHYYWVWAQNLSLSYYDHPPFVAWLFKIGDMLPDFMIKWPAVLFGHSALLIWARLLTNLGWTEEQTKNWFFLSVMAPLVGLAAMVLTPDLPLLFFQALAIYSFERSLTRQRARDYALFGMALGLGFSSKYHIVLLIPCFILFLAVSGQWRKVQWRFLPLVIGLGLIGSFPVWFWNYQNDWASFRFQLHHGVGKKTWKPVWPIEYILSVLFLIVPIYWLLFKKAVSENKEKLMIWLSLPIIGFFILTSFRSKVEANWSQLAFLPLLSLLARYEVKPWRARFVALLWTGCLGALVFFWSRPWYPGCPEKLCEPRRFEALPALTKDYQPFYASSYQMASYLWFMTKQPVFKLMDMSRRDYFDSFSEALPKGDFFYLAKHQDTNLPEWLRRSSYQMEMVREIDPELRLLRFSKPKESK
jgi:4-amino-4-deoxy-L-arabinose transferase-like glycosyltransferase